jgi:regulator of protease activity HflC (stomatin/prohibitin superfamily)
MENLSGPGGAMQGAMGRLNRMTDPNAGKRPGDEKLGCEQIKAEFDDTREKHSTQLARQDAARAAAENDARKAQVEASGPGAIAKGFLGGLGAVAAHAIGSGDAYNEKLKAEAIATQSRRQELQNSFAEEAETTKALGDRGRALMSLDNAKGCNGLVYKP